MFSCLSFVRSQFRDSFRLLRRTQTITAVGLMLAVQMVLDSYGAIEISDSLRITLSHLALAPTAIFFGPAAAGIQGALSDLLAFMLRPSGPYFPGFTLSSLLAGVIYGLFLYKTKNRLWQIIAARVLVCVLLNIALNTVFLVILYGPSRLATLPVRALKTLIQLPFDCVLLSAVCKMVRRLPLKSAGR